MNAPGAFRWNGASPPPGDDQDTAIPLLLYSASGRATVISPATNWMLAVHDHSLGGPGFGAGVKASVASLPPGFVHETVIVGGAAPGAAMDNLGDALRALSGKPRTDAYADFVLSHLGYWSEFPPQEPLPPCTHTDSNCETTLPRPTQILNQRSGLRRLLLPHDERLRQPRAGNDRRSGAREKPLHPFPVLSVGRLVSD